MYDELIKWLRVLCESCKLWDGYKCCLKGECSARKRLQAADAIEELSAINQRQLLEIAVLMTKPRWVPVTERLPEERTDVLAMTENCDIYVCDFIPSVRQFWTIPGDDLHINDISHWMPLPQPPESEGKT